MKRSIQIRQGVFEDLFGIVQLLHEVLPETEFPIPDYDQAFAYAQILNFIKGQAVWVAVCDGRVVGVAILSPARRWFTNAFHFLENQEFAIHPDFRAGRTASKLIDKMKGAADTAGVPLVIRITSGNRAEIKDRFMGQEGFTYLGGNLLYKPLTAGA